MIATGRSSVPLEIKPPYIAIRGVGTVAVDITFGESLPEPESCYAVFCLGRHPAAECIVPIEGSGRNHPPVLAIDPLYETHVALAEAMMAYLDPSLNFQVTTLRELHERAR